MNSEERRLHAQTQSAFDRSEAILAHTERRLAEHVELVAMVKRHVFAFRALAELNASLNEDARTECRKLARDAEQLLAKVKQ